MEKRRLPVIGLSLALALAVSVGCNGQSIDENVATVNALATQAAGGASAAGGGEAEGTVAPTDPPNLRDLTGDPSGLLVRAWGQTNGLPSGSEFTIVATEDQVGVFVIETLQLSGWEDSVQGGSVVIDVGQIRLDMALVDANGDFGSGAVSFQPTLDELGRVKLNPLGGDFGGLKLPDGLTGAFGDAVLNALIGAPNDNLSKVTLNSLSLEDGVMRVSGTVR
jgi:hypothetical protein